MNKKTMVKIALFFLSIAFLYMMITNMKFNNALYVSGTFNVEVVYLALFLVLMPLSLAI
jgi:hypothetical protein